MKISKAKWFNDADSPVVLMIDDFNNLWFDLTGRGYPRLGADWGHWRDLPNSSFAFLKENLVDKFPEAKVTFFTVVGSPIWRFKYGKVYGGTIRQDGEVAGFFRHIHHLPNFEIAYHGLTHGVIRNGEYIHEWLSFNSVKEALANIEKGQKIYEGVFGERSKGGKYPGYASNMYSDESIDRGGFLWWCRDWTYQKFVSAGNNYAILEMKTFGENGVVDFPSTVNPSIWGRDPLRRVAQVALRNPRQWGKLEGLLHNRKVISIQEHAGAIKANGIRQTPNIIDDMPVLKSIYSFLGKKNVWHATCSEIVNYYVAFACSEIELEGENGFRITYSGRVEKPWLSVLINREIPLAVISPSGRRYEGIKHPHKDGQALVNIEVENGYYQVREIE